MSTICNAFVDSGKTRPSSRGLVGYEREHVCATCGWAESAHTEETRAIQRGEHPDAVPVRWADGETGFVRKAKWGAR